MLHKNTEHRQSFKAITEKHICIHVSSITCVIAVKTGILFSRLQTILS